MADRSCLCSWVFLLTSPKPLNLRVPHPSRFPAKGGHLRSNVTTPLLSALGFFFSLSPLCSLCSDLCDRRLPRPSRGVTVPLPLFLAAANLSILCVIFAPSLFLSSFSARSLSRPGRGDLCVSLLLLPDR